MCKQPDSTQDRWPIVQLGVTLASSRTARATAQPANVDGQQSNRVVRSNSRGICPGTEGTNPISSAFAAVIGGRRTLKKGDKLFCRITKECLCLMGRTRPQQSDCIIREAFSSATHDPLECERINDDGGERKKLYSAHVFLHPYVHNSGLCAVLYSFSARELGSICSARRETSTQHPAHNAIHIA